MATTKIISDVSVDGAVKIVPLNGSKALASSSDGTVVESSTTATELGYVHGVTSGIQGQIDAVAQSAARGLKLVDLTTYSGSTDGEIVRHNGATTERYVNGWDYKFTSLSIPPDSYYVDARNASSSVSEYISKSIFVSTEVVSRGWVLYSTPGYIYSYAQSLMHVGDPVVMYEDDELTVGYVSVITDTAFSYDTAKASYTVQFSTALQYYNIYYMSNVQDPTDKWAYINVSTILLYEDGEYKLYATEYQFFSEVYPQYTVEEIPIGSGWQQWDSQPSSVAEVSDLKTRMTAAETAISGKQAALTFDDAPMANSGNVVKSGGVKAAIDSAPRFYIGTCSTAGNVAVKQVDIADFPTTLVNGVETPIVGSVIAVKFSNTDAAASEQKKIKVNNTSACGVWTNAAEQTSTAASATVFGAAGRYIYYVFDGTYWVWVNHGVDSNTTYTAGSGLKLSSNQFSLNVPNVTKSANSLPGQNTAIFEEYSGGTNYNLPSNNFYHIITMEGANANYATQLALGMTTSAAYYRNYNQSTWGSWLRLDNPTMDSTPTAGNTANVVSSAGTKTYVDEQVATKSSITIRQWVTE